ncbi:hypothetical protein E1H13_25760 [Nodosilinea sp. P-1105]|nr:hypothetical protein [Nodosilinea sp. P-1105]
MAEPPWIGTQAEPGHQRKLLPLLYGQVLIPEAVYRELVDIDPPVPGGAETQTAAPTQQAKENR